MNIEQASDCKGDRLMDSFHFQMEHAWHTGSDQNILDCKGIRTRSFTSSFYGKLFQTTESTMDLGCERITASTSPT